MNDLYVHLHNTRAVDIDLHTSMRTVLGPGCSPIETTLRDLGFTCIQWQASTIAQQDLLCAVWRDEDETTLALVTREFGVWCTRFLSITPQGRLLTEHLGEGFRPEPGTRDPELIHSDVADAYLSIQDVCTQPSPGGRLAAPEVHQVCRGALIDAYASHQAVVTPVQADCLPLHAIDRLALATTPFSSWTGELVYIGVWLLEGVSAALIHVFDRSPATLLDGLGISVLLAVGILSAWLPYRIYQARHRLVFSHLSIADLRALRRHGQQETEDPRPCGTYVQQLRDRGFHCVATLDTLNSPVHIWHGPQKRTWVEQSADTLVLRSRTRRNLIVETWVDPTLSIWRRLNPFDPVYRHRSQRLHGLHVRVVHTLDEGLATHTSGQAMPHLEDALSCSQQSARMGAKPHHSIGGILLSLLFFGIVLTHGALFFTADIRPNSFLWHHLMPLCCMISMARGIWLRAIRPIDLTLLYGLVVVSHLGPFPSPLTAYLDISVLTNPYPWLAYELCIVAVVLGLSYGCWLIEQIVSDAWNRRRTPRTLATEVMH